MCVCELHTSPHWHLHLNRLHRPTQVKYLVKYNIRISGQKKEILTSTAFEFCEPSSLALRK